ncbi:Rad52/Rad22 family DNA repair protein [Halomonas salifodinae]|uniref:Rad52/Rad22 family DNA repair protein n=1 Tax=Halomonas salifodinae TaxID=438745 RepID=A0ABW2EYI5_9GAMM
MNPDTDHLALWRQVEKTPTTAIKPADVDGQKIMTLDQIYVIQLATELFGPMGIGWGYRIEDERYDQGAPILDVKTGALITHEQTHTVRLVLWYRWQGEKGEVTQFGHTRAVYRTNNGRWKTDGEAPKKSVTDAIKKCLSLLGFAADVYGGKFDNLGYLQERQAETELEMAEDFDAALQEKRDEFKSWLEKQCNGFAMIPHPSSVQKVLAIQLEQLPRRASIARLDEDAQRFAHERLNAAAQEAIEKLRQAKAAEKATQQNPEETTHE